MTTANTDASEERKLRQELFAELKEDVHRRELSNTENFDKAIISLTTAFLALSLAFLKDFGLYHVVKWEALLPVSWFLLLAAIFATLTSFFVSNAALRKQLKKGEKYYIDHDESAFSSENKESRWTDRLNIASAVSFFLGVLGTIVFVTINLNGGGHMGKKDAGQSISDRGATVPTVQMVPKLIQKGATTPTLQKIPQESSSSAGSTPITGSTGESSAGSSDGGAGGTSSEAKQ